MKSIQLIELILNDKGYSANDLQVTLYDHVNYGAFNKLINRLKDKIYEIILFDHNLEKSVSAKRNRVIFDIRKRLIQSEILFSRGMNDEIESFQNKIIKKAKQYEVYDSLLEALHSKQRYLGFRFGSIGHRKLKEEIEYYEDNRLATIRAREIFNSMTTKINFSASPREYEVELNDSIAILKNDYKNTKSPTVGYYYFFLETERLQNCNNLIGSGKVLIQLKELLENNTSIYTDNRMGYTLMNISNNEILKFDFNNSIQNIKEAFNYYSDSIINTSVVIELEFFSLFYMGKNDEAEKLIEELYHTSRSTNIPFLYGKRTYLFACLKTLEGEYVRSNELLSEISEIAKDKEGWNIGKRILTIINRIETKDFESVDLQVQNLQKHIKRTLKTKHVRKRDILILRILLKLINEQFDFSKVYKSRQRYFELLESDDAEYRWKIKSPELILFHEWFTSKVENRPYNHSAALEKEKEKNVLIGANYLQKHE